MSSAIVHAPTPRPMAPTPETLLAGQLLDRAAREDVPDLDDVAGRVLEVDRAVTAVVLLGPSDRRASAVEGVAQAVEASGCGGEREVDVTAAAVPELLRARRPQPEARGGAGGEPDPVVLAGEDAEPEHVDVEALEARKVVGLER